MLRIGFCLIASVFSMAVASLSPAQSPGLTDSWDSLADDFTDQHFAFNPSLATNAGIHRHDSELEDYSARAIAKQVAWYQQFEKRVLAFDPNNLNATDAADR